MSVSGLHHKFRAVTTMGPLRYQKQLRLQEARSLRLRGSTDVTTAALRVGYESLSQFSREYQRLLGLPPLKDTKSIRKISAAMHSKAIRLIRISKWVVCKAMNRLHQLNIDFCKNRKALFV